MLPKEILDHYLEAHESMRLARVHNLERLRTQAILARHLPAPPAVILDVGGASGVYAFPLAAQGYEVHLIDPVELHLEQARACSAESGVSLASIAAGDARRLKEASQFADAVLLLGPLYHLTEAADRQQALREAHRVLKPGGVLIAAAISRFASLLDGLVRGFLRDPEFRKIVAADLASGQHRNPTNDPKYFTTAYFHRPEELAAEVSEAGFQNVRVLAVEGPAWGVELDDPDLMAYLELIEQEPSIVGASAHFLAVAQPPPTQDLLNCRKP